MFVPQDATHRHTSGRGFARSLTLVLLPVLMLLMLMPAGCSKYNRMAKSRKIADRDSAAFYFYRKRKFEAASLLFEDLLTTYRGTPRAAVITYYYARTLYDNKMYLTAANYFQQYVDQFPNGDNTEDALLYIAKSYDAMSLDHEKDQKETVRAIEQYELFTSIYPTSKLAAEATKRRGDLLERLAHKDFEAARLYYNIGQFRAAVVTSKAVLNDHPASSFREPAQLLLFQSAAAYAKASIPQRQLERYRESVIYYERFLARFPNSPQLREAEKTYEDVTEALAKLERNPAAIDTTRSLLDDE